MPMLDITRLSSNLSIQSNQAPERGRPKPVWDTPCVLDGSKSVAAQGIGGSCLINNRRTEKTVASKTKERHGMQ